MASAQRVQARTLTVQDALELGTDAYVFGYPLVVMDVTRAVSIAGERLLVVDDVQRQASVREEPDQPLRHRRPRQTARGCRRLSDHLRPEGLAGKEKESNWLPAPPGPFNVFMRLYWPKQEILDGTWKMPPVERVE